VHVPPFSFAFPSKPEIVAAAPLLARAAPEGGWLLENEVLRVHVTAKGTLASLFHKPSAREALKDVGNVFVIYDDVNL
jgi:hypothetical protein